MADDPSASARGPDLIHEANVDADDLGVNEGLLRAVFDSALDALVTINEAGIIDAVNPATESIFGHPRAELIGRNVSVLMPEPYRSQHDGYIRRFLETGERRIIGIGREVLGRRRDGSTFPMDLAVTKFWVGGQRHFLGIIRDISDRKAEEQYRSALAAREAHQRGRMEIAVGILHDLGNVLSGIGARLGNARALIDIQEPLGALRRTIHFLGGQRELLDAALGGKGTPLIELLATVADSIQESEEKASEDVDRALTYVLHAQEVLTTFRRYSGAGAGSARESLEVERLLTDAQLMMSDAVLKHSAALRLHCSRDLPPLHTERSKVMQLLLNLLKNGLEAVQESPVNAAPAIDIHAYSHGGELVIEICDNGPGFDEEIARHLFTEGFSTKQRGSGLGLVGSRRIARELGGELTLESHGPGTGATARLNLPLRES